MKKWIAACLAGLLLLGTTACGGGLSQEDARIYVRGLLDETYRGSCDKDYLLLVDTTKEAVRTAYEASLEVEYRYFSENFRFDEERITEGTRAEALEVIADLYSHARYDVSTPFRSAEEFVVEVSVQPYDLPAVIHEEHMAAYITAFQEKYAYMTEAALAAKSMQEQEAFWTAYENDWAKGILDLFRTHAAQGSHLPAQRVLVRLTKDASGYYAMEDNDFSNLDSLILAYTRPISQEAMPTLPSGETQTPPQ